MLIIDRTARTTEGFIIRAKERGKGGGWKIEVKTIEEVSAVLNHYYSGTRLCGQMSCPLCRQLTKGGVYATTP